MISKLKIIPGSSNPQLVEDVCKILDEPIGKVNVSKGPDGETKIEFEESVRGRDVYVIQSTCPPVNDNIMELLIMLDALKRSSPSRVTAVIPYLGYARQDRKHGPREPISSKLVADLISVAGPSRVIFLDLHAIQIQGFFNIPADDLCPDKLIVEYLQEKQLTGENTTIVANNPGSARRARRVARMVNAKIALIENRILNEKSTQKKVLNVVGKIEENCFIIDDMIDTGTKLCLAAELLKKNGAKKVYSWATHAVLSADVKKLQESEVDEIVVTDSISLPEEKNFPKLKIRSIAPIIAEAIKRIHNEESMSDMFSGI